MNFKKVTIELVNRQHSEINLSKIVGDVLWGSATTIAQNRLAQRIYDEEDVELKEEDKAWVLRSLSGKLNYATCDAVKKMLEGEEQS